MSGVREASLMSRHIYSKADSEIKITKGGKVCSALAGEPKNSDGAVQYQILKPQ